MDLLNSPLVEWFEKVIDSIAAYRSYIVVGALATSIAAVSYIGYGYYRKSIQQVAHHDLVAALRYFDAPVVAEAKQQNKLQFATESEKWKEVALQFNEGYKRNASSTLAPLFLAFHSEALINLGEFEEAIRSLTEAVTTMSDIRLQEYYHLKLALLKLDNKNDAYHKEGFDILQKIAFNQQHIAHDQALYHIGLYLWVNKKFDEAKNYWQQFMVKYGNEQALDPLIHDVRSKLELIAV